MMQDGASVMSGIGGLEAVLLEVAGQQPRLAACLASSGLLGRYLAATHGDMDGVVSQVGLYSSRSCHYCGVS